MTDEDKIIQLFESGQYKLAYSLRDSLNIEINYSKINLGGMTMRLSEGTTMYITSKTGLEFEIEIISRQDPDFDMDWVDLDNAPGGLESLCDYINDKYGTSCYVDHSPTRMVVYSSAETYLDINNIPKIIKYFFEG